MTRRRRLDDELVEQGFFSNREDAMRAVMAGEVSTQDRRLERAGEQVEPGIVLHVRGHIPFVSRGGLKLERGLQAFDVDPTGLACLDVGCSTGGFTDCLLKHGAASVLSVDVGYAQFDWSLRSDPRVTLLERTNIVDVPTPERDGTIRLAVCDVSFTSVETALPAVISLLSPEGAFLTLVKPQFEAARNEVGEGGVVRDSAVRLHSLERIATAFTNAGLGPVGCCESPVRGHKGNVEYLMYGHRGAAPTELDLNSVVSEGAVVLA
ncbi:MAG: TlyA family RNA methyltransferase [Olsenella sp.]|nr:TlyA family RNA methyltransferase [Olsenella sp.]MCH3957992.1 TlyA family RNA methyltransferase [Olsenella sp.]MCI1644894.1 TlyA family RNA methyltransferase [Olsenella sp.]MCI1666847.1 TlyA family RNA methyltransferase [Olsenella sp.]MCI1792726.1 TlyA family RNA methyltransferase [Olsenella sp.]